MDKNLEAIYGKPDFNKGDYKLWFEYCVGIRDFDNGCLFTIEFYEGEVYYDYYKPGNRFVYEIIHETYKKWINEKFEQIVLKE